MMGVPGLVFASAWKRRVDGRYGDVPIHVLSMKDIMVAKVKAGRPQDLLDLAALRNVQKMARRKKRS